MSLYVRPRSAMLLHLITATAVLAEWQPGFHAPGVSADVNAMAVFDDGSGPALFVAGGNGFQGAPGWRMVSWRNGSWFTVGGDFNNFVHALAVYDDGSGPALYAGGQFTIAGGTPANCVAKWDGKQWSSLGSGMDGTARRVDALLVFDDGTGPSLFAGGTFTTAGGVAAQGIAKWDGNSWAAVGASGPGGASGFVLALATFDDGGGPALYAAGEFNGVAKWNGLSWSLLGSGMDDFVSALAVYDDGSGAALYAGGFFTSAGGQPATSLIAKWNGSAWSAVNMGSWTEFGFISSLATFDDGSGMALYAGGAFDLAGGVAARAIAKWDGASWAPVGSGPLEFGSVFTLASYDYGEGPTLFAGGNFQTMGGLDVNRIAQWKDHAWRTLGGAGTDGTFREVYGLCVFDDGTGPALYAGGAFDAAGGIFVNHVAKWDGSAWSDLGAEMDGHPYALAAFDDGSGLALYVGGQFFNQDCNLARWNGSAWSDVGTGMNGHVNALAVFDDGSGPALYAGGGFSTASGVAANNIARWNGSAWSAVGTGYPSFLKALVVFDDGTGPALYAGGTSSVKKWNGTIWSNLPPALSDVDSLAVFDDGNGPALYASHGVPFKWDGTTWTQVGSGFGGIQLLAVMDDGTGPALYAGTGNDIAKWNGATWSSLGQLEGFGIQVDAMATYNDGTQPAIYVGGRFTTIDGVPSSNIAKWKVASTPGPIPAISQWGLCCLLLLLLCTGTLVLRQLRNE